MSIVTDITEWLLAKVQPYVLELGSANFRKIKGFYKNEKFVLSEDLVIPAPSDIVFSNRLSEAVYDHDSVISRLKQMFPKSKYEEQYVSLIIPDHAFLLGSFTVPAVTLKIGFMPMLEREIQKNSTMPFTEFDIRFEVGQKIGKKNIIHYCALPKGVTRDLEFVCQGAGLIPLAIQPSFTGLVKLARITSEAQYTYALLHMGNESITAAIYSSDGLKQIQVIDVGAFDFIRNIEKGMNLTFDEARKTLEEELILLEDPTSEAQFEIENYKVLEPIFTELLKKIYGFLLLYTNDNPDEKGFAKIILSGGLSKMKNIDKLISSNLGINTSFIGEGISRYVNSDSIPETETIESIAPMLGNIMIKPWDADGYERVLVA